MDVKLIERAFLRGRARDTALNVVWATVLVAAGTLLSGSWLTALPYASLVIAEVLVFSWVGYGIGRRALSAVVLGTLPLSAAVCSSVVGHVCTPGGCMSLCAPFCGAGGFFAGLLLARWAAMNPRPVAAWLSGSLLVVTTGAIGCACVGAAGILGMTTGLLISSSLWWIRSRLTVTL